MNAVSHNHNQGSIFDPILSLETWRTKCDAENIGSVHVDLTFLEAFLGDESDSKVRFQASLKRAVVKLYVSNRDPIKVVRDSVDRGLVNKRNLELSERQKTDFSTSANLSVGTTPQILNANADIGIGHSAERELITTGTEIVTPHNIQQYVSNEMYCWEVTPRNNSALLGKIWDAVAEPRLSVIMSNAIARSSDCEVRVIIECRRQDIEIRNIQLKDKKLRLASLRDAKNNLVAAEAVIKKLIYEKGFDVENFSEPFAAITITSVTVPEE